MEGRSHIWRGKARNEGLSLVVMGTMLSAVPVPVVRAADKETTYNELQQLGARIESVKADPANMLAGEAMMARYRELSRQVGGDDPAQVLGGSGGGLAAASGGPQNG